MTNTLMDIDTLRTRASAQSNPAEQPAPSAPSAPSAQSAQSSQPDQRYAPAAGERPGSATLRLGADGAELPRAGELAALLSRVPVARVQLAQAVDFSALPDHAIVRMLALIRECSSIGVRVAWSLVLDARRLDALSRLDHLPAPAAIRVPDERAESADDWRSAGKFGLFYFRKGPGFVSVVDQRPESGRRIILDDPVLMEVFLDALDGCAWPEAARTPHHAAASRALEEQGLIMRVGDHCVTLPVHMRTWPLGAALLGGTLASAGRKPDETAG